MSSENLCLAMVTGVFTSFTTYGVITYMNTLFKSLVIASAFGIAALPLSTTIAADAAQKPAKEVSCKQEANSKGIKDKAEKKAYIKECENKRKAAHSK